jgi:Patatin-like phospholipase
VHFGRRLLGVYLPRLYLQRFPVLLGALLLAYVPFALLVVPAMFRSTLVLTSRGLAVVTMLTCLSASVVMSMRRTILLCGPARFNVRWPTPRPEVSVWSFAAHLSAAAPIVVIGGWLSATEGALGWGHTALSIVAGLGGAAVLQLAAMAVYAWLVQANESLPDLLVPRTRVIFRQLHQRDAPQGRLGRVVQRMLLWARPYLGPGYFTSTGAVEPAHLYAAGMLAAFGLVYWGAYFVGKPQYDRGIPALFFILVLATLVAIVLAGVAFLLDRHRLPTLLPILLWITAMSWLSKSDHYFRLTPSSYVLTAPTPYEIATTRRPLLTIVAVDGGGIQAAAWAATVLTHVEEKWRDFHRSIGVISSVSGGSLGTVYFISALPADGPVTDEQLRGVREAATRGSLGEAGWGLAYADLWRILVPIRWFRFEKDRGWAMERAWRRNFPPDQVPKLSDWIAGARAGRIPAISLNATTVESGQRFAFATFLPPEADETQTGRRPWSLGTVLGTYPKEDIDLPTAARLSATFPYVSPIATAWPGPGIPAWHYADGGYYDNTGMGIAMRWLDTAMLGHESEYRNRAIAFIRVRSSPAGNEDPPKERAWAYDLIGPLVTLLNVRTTGQRERAETELDFLQRLWCRQGVAIRKFEFGFDLPEDRPSARSAMKDPPLSWQLTSTEIADLESAWNQKSNQDALNGYLALKESPDPGACRVSAPSASPESPAGPHRIP